jgi:hypothetical protein
VQEGCLLRRSRRRKDKGERIKENEKKKAKGQRTGLLKPLSFDL